MAGTLLSSGPVPAMATLVSYPAARGQWSSAGLVSISKQSLPDDPVGYHTVTLKNVVVGSRINIRDQNGTTTLYDQIATVADVAISLQVYAAGSPLNNWRIKVRKASSSPYFQPYETLMTAAVGASSIYVSQIPDE